MSDGYGMLLPFLLCCFLLAVKRRILSYGAQFLQFIVAVCKPSLHVFSRLNEDGGALLFVG